MFSCVGGDQQRKHILGGVKKGVESVDGEIGGTVVAKKIKIAVKKKRGTNGSGLGAPRKEKADPSEGYRTRGALGESGNFLHRREKQSGYLGKGVFGRKNLLELRQGEWKKTF